MKPNAPAHSASSKSTGAQTLALSLEGIDKSFQDSAQTVQVLHQAHLAVALRERVALLGPSGSGKTTLLNIAAGLESADRGQVLIAGQDLTPLDERARSLLRRRHLGFIFQSFNLFPQLTAAANIRVSLRLNGLRDRQWQDYQQELMQRMGIAKLAQRYPHQLSGGEQQRVAIARALVHRPALVLADEPTGNLDQAHAAEVLAILEEVSGDCGLLLVTHSQRAARLCHRVLTMVNGTPQASVASDDE
jgi:putative ABC transport system ATP-binding protein